MIWYAILVIWRRYNAHGSPRTTRKPGWWHFLFGRITYICTPVSRVIISSNIDTTRWCTADWNEDLHVRWDVLNYRVDHDDIQQGIHQFLSLGERWQDLHNTISHIEIHSHSDGLVQEKRDWSHVLSSSGPILTTNIPFQFEFGGNSFCCNSIDAYQIGTNIYICDDSTAVYRNLDERLDENRRGNGPW